MEPQSPNRAAAPARANPIRRLYDWVLSWAENPNGSIALGVLAFVESSFFPIPPDPLLMALALGKPRRALRFAAICSVASVLGGLAGYAIGWGIWSLVQDLFFSYVPGMSPEVFDRVGELYDRWDFWAVFIAGFTPIPFKVFTVAAGIFKITLPTFILASLIGRSLRFFLIAGLIFYAGPSIQTFIDRYFDRLVWLFLLLLIGGFLLVEFVI